LELFASELFCSELFSSKLFRSELLRFQFLNDNRHYRLLSENVLLMPMRKKNDFHPTLVIFLKNFYLQKKPWALILLNLMLELTTQKLSKMEKG